MTPRAERLKRHTREARRSRTLAGEAVREIVRVTSAWLEEDTTIRLQTRSGMTFESYAAAVPEAEGETSA